MVTSFVMSVYDQWFLMTAGHCIADIEENMRNGYEIERCRLIDCMGTGAQHREPIPFDYGEATATKICYDPKYDYGVIFLNDHYRRLLAANGVKPLTEEVWEQQPERVDFYALIGVPNELSETTAHAAHVTTTLHRVIALPEKPECFEETDAPTFFGEIVISEPMTDISGMSGGPIFSFRKEKDGTMRYWLHAIQSRWIPSRRLIAACLAHPLGMFLKEFMDGKHQHLVDKSAAGAA